MTEVNKIKVGIIGSAGYTGGELLRLLLLHPAVEIIFAYSKNCAGKYVHEIHTDLYGDTNLIFTNTIHIDIDVMFLCNAHGESKYFIENTELNPETHIIDLSQDFRWIESPHNFIYGLPELQREKIKAAKNIANPGCFATSIQLALLPLAAKNLLQNPIHITSTTGSTGAGQGLSLTSHYSWRNNNLSVYKPFEHQHLHEIGQSIATIQQDFDQPMYFIPQRGSFTRGIFSSIYTELDLSIDEVQEIFQNYYNTHPFTFVRSDSIDLKQVINTNKSFIKVQKFKENVFIECVIDNLLKGASGQAVQNMNLMFGLDESSGLKLKGVGF
ncbi:MAG: N-acetyl-gamma-glutamyl-phosphate reductase [Bacteroidetes bacterium]|nr:N-acetyl-gamma-glutamyl-phosphate reductase [Bacteroidota bacterium]